MTRLLVVEDDNDFADTLAEVFEAAGFMVKTAGDGSTGLDLYRKWHPQVVITDMVMPELEGIGLIRELGKETTRPTIVAISGGGQNVVSERKSVIQSYLDSAREEGASLTYSKPVDFFKLLRDITAISGSHGHLASSASAV